MNRGRQLGLWATVAIGVGGMVGGGIFAVLGLSVQLTRGGAPLAFLLAGLVALLTVHAYARLSVTYPSQGGTVEFLNRAFGRGLLSGSLNVLLWLSYMIMLALYAYAFGGYAASLAGLQDSALARHAFISLSVIALTLLNAAGAAFVGRAELWIVVLKIAILLLFVVAGIGQIEPQRLAPGAWSPPLTLAAGGMLIFLAFEGFELIANTAHEVRDPRKNLPRAYYVAVGFVILLYVAVACVTVGSLPVEAIVGARDYALAEAARPALGAAGFGLVSVAAVLSTASAINATLYGATRVSYIIAKEGELPEVLDRKVWRRPIEGLLLTSAATLLIANLFDLSSIATIGSAGFLIIFAAVNAAALRRRQEARVHPTLATLGLLACLTALTALVAYALRHQPWHAFALPVLMLIAVGVEGLYRLTPSRRGRS